METRPKVFVTRKISREAMDLIESECQTFVNPHDRVLSREELAEAGKDIEGLLCLLTDPIDAELIDKMPCLKIIANFAVGYDNIDVEACTKRNIAVSNTPGVLTETTADMAWALLQAVARRVVEADRYVREGKFKTWAPMLFLGHDINDKTLGLIGLGRIGSAVAGRAAGFNMPVIYYSENRKSSNEEKELGVEYRSFKRLLKEADFISLHVPLNKKTRHLIGKEELEIMKPEAYLINTSRGPVIDEEALVAALRHNEIAGAALDVYEDEPQIAPGLADMANVILTPHIASATVETRTRMAVMAAKNLLSGLKGEKIPNLVNRELENNNKATGK